MIKGIFDEVRLLAVQLLLGFALYVAPKGHPDTVLLAEAIINLVEKFQAVLGVEVSKKGSGCRSRIDLPKGCVGVATCDTEGIEKIFHCLFFSDINNFCLVLDIILIAVFVGVLTFLIFLNN